MEPVADLFWLSALDVRRYVCIYCKLVLVEGGNIYLELSLFVLLYNTNFMNFMFFNLQNHPTFHSQKWLVNLVRERECVVGLYLNY